MKAVPSDVIVPIEFSRGGNIGLHPLAETMRNTSLKDKAKITAGAVTALVIVAWLAIIALAFLSLG